MGLHKELDALREQASENIVDAADLYDSLDKQARTEFAVKVSDILMGLIVATLAIARSKKE